MKKKAIYRILLAAVLIWIAATHYVQRFKNPSLSETELALLLPKNFILQFEEDQP